jgi:integrase
MHPSARPSKASFGYQTATYLVRRGNIWQYRRRVPKLLVEHLATTEIRVSTKARDRTDAMRAAVQISAALEAHWSKLIGADPTARAAADFQAAISTAEALGVPYRPVAEIAASRLEDLLARIERLAQPLNYLPSSAVSAMPRACEIPSLPPTPDPVLAPAPAIVSAVLGGASKPELTLSTLVDAYQKLASDQTIGKSEKQLKQWKGKHQRAVDALISRIGDKPLAEITRDDALDFRDWWIARIRNEGYTRNSANKNFGCLAGMMRTVDDAFRLNLSLPFKGVRIAGAKYTRRQAYEPDFVRQHFLTPIKIGGLNAEAADIVRIVALTGMRPSEIVALEEHRIRLDDPVPHLQIRPDARQLKTGASERDMPLVGQALEIMRRHPEGFPRYRASADSFSAIANKCLDSAGLRPTRAHSVYSLRHTFKDRMIAAGIPERIQDELMGHTLKGMPYGNGSTLRHRAEWMAKIWG